MSSTGMPRSSRDFTISSEMCFPVMRASLLNCRKRYRRSGRPMSHVRPHADVYTLVVENKLIRAVSWEKVCRPLFCVHTT